ncbi:MAG: DUF1638 domain-containing protein [Emergencia sp.]
MSTVIMACGNLLTHVKAAQAKEGTAYEIIELDSRLHAEPKDMREALFEKMEELPGDVDTVLLAMGHCGGSVSQRPLPKRLVMPKVDDCITMLLHRDDTWHPNLKEGGHLYITDSVDDRLSASGIRDSLIEKYGEKKGLKVFDIWFDSYRSVDIIDTGVYDSFSAAYLKSARKNADLIGCPLCHVPGSNLLLEKLVAGRWDHQFLIAEKGRVLKEEDFLA